MSYREVLQLPFDVFQLMRKNYIVDKLNETEEGREYLEKCERLTKTNIDIDAIRKKIKEGENK